MNKHIILKSDGNGAVYVPKQELTGSIIVVKIAADKSALWSYLIWGTNGIGVITSAVNVDKLQLIEVSVDVSAILSCSFEDVQLAVELNSSHDEVVEFDIEVT